MIFLQPLLLAALPLVALPILIHLINQRRYQTMPWAAMMFLLAANRMSRGYARIRQWLILLFRALVIAMLVFAISRPLSSGWIGGAAGGAADTTILLIDRSPSMQQQRAGSQLSKLETGTAQLARSLSALGDSRYVTIDNATNTPRELESVDQLATAGQSSPTDAAADLPSMMLAALDYMRANQVGRTDIWILSDVRENDWNASDGRWQSLREAFTGLGGRVRFHLLAYPDPPRQNRSVRVTDVEHVQSGDRDELRISLRITGEAGEGASEGAGDESGEQVPVEFEIDGARSVLDVPWNGPVVELKDHRLSLPAGSARGWGRVSIPADANPADNDYYFVFDTPPPRRAIVVGDDPAVTRPLELAAGIPPAAGVVTEAETIAREHLASVAWEQVGLVLWQGTLPQNDEAALVTSVVEAGGRVIFFPPLSAGPETIFGVGWQQWHESAEGLGVSSWRGDVDLLQSALSGEALSVGDVRVTQYSSLQGDTTPLATLTDGTPLWVRVPTPRGGVYFCATTPHPEHSTLARNGVVLYAAVQRALASGAEALGQVRQRTTGELPPEETSDWTRLAGPDQALSTEHSVRSGIYADGDQLWALNRSEAEDRGAVVDQQQLAGLFDGLHFQRVDDQAGNLDALVHEVWRLFLVLMVLAMLGEAALSLPNRSLARPSFLAGDAARGGRGMKGDAA